MKSPFRGLPDLLPVLPEHALRLTLAPSEAIALYIALEQSCAAMEQKAAASDPRMAGFIEALNDLRDKLGDKLAFRPVSTAS